MKSKGIVITAIAFLSLIGMQDVYSQMIVAVKPSRAKVVVVKPARPDIQHVWVDGHWKWSKKRQRYVWVNGQWAKKPRNKSRWISGHWKKVRGGWTYLPGHWV